MEGKEHYFSIAYRYFLVKFLWWSLMNNDHETVSKLPIYCNCAVSAAPSSVLVSVYSPYTPSSSVLGSHETAQFRDEMEF